MKEATAKRREKPRAEKEKSGAEPQDVEMKEEDQRAPRELDQMTLDGLNNTQTHTYIYIYHHYHIYQSRLERWCLPVKPF